MVLIETVARFLALLARCRTLGEIVDAGHTRGRDLALEVLSSLLEAVMLAEVWTQVYERIAVLALEHRTTLVFVNTRRMAEAASPGNCRTGSARSTSPRTTAAWPRTCASTPSSV